MKFKRFIKDVYNSRAAEVVRRALSSYFFPLAAAFVTVLCYYMGWEVVTVWFFGISGAAILLLCKDVSPVLVLLLFLNIMVSVKHSPGYMGAASDYFVRPAQLAQEIIALVPFILALVWRTVDGIIKGRFKITPMFWGLAAFCAALTLGGLFYSNYHHMSLLYGLALTAVLLGVYVFVYGNFTFDEKAIVKTAYYLAVFFGSVALQLIVAYCTYEGLIVDGVVQRSLLFFGWGTYNNMGVLLMLTLPAWFYLAGKFTHGYAFLTGAVFNFICCFLTMSRQTILMSIFVFFACCVWLLVWNGGKKRIINGAIIAAVVIVSVVLVVVYKQDLKQFLLVLSESLETGNGRLELWEWGFDNFKRKPLFGVGWYDPSAPYGKPGYWGGTLSYSIARMCHNTYVQLLSACGIFGLLTYVAHRTQTVISLIENPRPERIFAFMTIIAIMLICFFDNHIFYFMPTSIYAVFTAIFAATEGKRTGGRRKI